MNQRNVIPTKKSCMVNLPIGLEKQKLKRKTIKEFILKKIKIS